MLGIVGGVALIIAIAAERRWVSYRELPLGKESEALARLHPCSRGNSKASMYIHAS